MAEHGLNATIGELLLELGSVPLGLRGEDSYKRAAQFVKAAQNNAFLRNERGAKAMLTRAEPYMRHVRALMRMRSAR